MRSIELWLASALMAALVLTGAAVAQPPPPKDGPQKKSSSESGRLSVDDIVERIMSFDKNKDGKVTKDELPERMHYLIELGDTNKDGALDRAEIKKLATTLAAAPGGFGGRGEFGSFGTGGAKGPQGPGLGGIEGVVDDLKLSGKKKDQAQAVVKAHQENVRKLMDQARAELLQKMKEILNEEELKDFQAALDRPRGGTSFSVGPKLDQKKKK